MLVVFFAYFCGGYKNNLRLQISEISLICNMNCILTGSIDANQIKLIERIALVNISILLFWSRSQYVMIVLKIAIRWEVFEISQPAITCSFSLFEQFLYFTRCSSASIRTGKCRLGSLQTKSFLIRFETFPFQTFTF